MATLDETVAAYDWTGGVYVIETGDPVEGGIDGISNLQAKQLTHRTRNLHSRTTTLESAVPQSLASAKSYNDSSIADLAGTLPEILEMLKSVNAALGNAAVFATTITQLFNGR